MQFASLIEGLMMSGSWLMGKGTWLVVGAHDGLVVEAHGRLMGSFLDSWGARGARGGSWWAHGGKPRGRQMFDWS